MSCLKTAKRDGSGKVQCGLGTRSSVQNSESKRPCSLASLPLLNLGHFGQASCHTGTNSGDKHNKGIFRLTDEIQLSS